MKKNDDKITVEAELEVTHSAVIGKGERKRIRRFENAWAYALSLPPEVRPIRISFIRFVRIED